MSDLNTLKHKRGILHGQITRLKTTLEIERNAQIPNIQSLELRLSIVEAVLEQFNELQIQIELQIDPTNTENIDAEEKKRAEFETYYFETISAVRDFINTFTEQIQPNARQGEGSQIVSEQQLANPFKVKLPTLTLPNFDGSYENWLFFKDTFNSLVHFNNEIPPIQKFHYLRLSLTSEAANVISSLEVSDASYPVAWSLLQERYENKELLVSNHVSALFDLPNVNKENHIDLRKLIDEISKHLRSLEVLGQPIDQWDTLIIHLVSSKLDPTTRRNWEDEKTKNKFSKFSEMADFLKQRCRLLETLNPVSTPTRPVEPKARTRSFVSTNASQCPICKQNHSIYNCPQFLKLSASSRLERVKTLHLCINCMRPGHSVINCRSRACKKCNKKHNSLLHFEYTTSDVGSPAPNSSHNGDQIRAEPQTQAAQSVSPAHSSINHSCQIKGNHVLLPTAIIEVLDHKGNRHKCRALLDSGSQSNFVTSELHNKLKNHETKINMYIVGINNSSSNVCHKTTLTVLSRSSSYKAKVECLIVPTISNSYAQFLPHFASDLSIPQNIFLADPDFDKSSNIDILLGCGIFWELLCTGQVNLGKGLPTLQKTTLGWVIAGNFPALTSKSLVSSHFIITSNLNSLDQNLTKFWELEELPVSKPLSLQEELCEKHFLENTSRDMGGRFIVTIPLLQPVVLGESFNAAVKRLESMEAEFEKKPSVKAQYCDFMEQYESLGHMSKIQNAESGVANYLPHHCVIRDSLTTKLRVVFDASNKTSNGKSFNDYQMVGPVLQDDLFSILLRFRKHRFVMCADVEKMYRQILVHPSQRDYQRVVWRTSPHDEISHYRLNTLTYGTTSASYIAVRALRQTAIENSSNFPEASKIILRDFFMDDLITGHDSAEALSALQNQIHSVLKQGCFPLKKWISNDSSVLQGVEGDSTSLDKLEICDKDPLKTLGLLWLPESDKLSYQVKLNSQNRSVCKRSILSVIAQLFDPFGLLGPCIVIPKIIIQKLWRLSLDWDESIPLSLYTQWVEFRNGLNLLVDLKLNRYIFTPNPSHVEIHGFCDASEAAYGACIYVRTIQADGAISVHLLCSKSRVSPTKTITIPRLELCGAVLLARLTAKVIKALEVSFDSVNYWRDSSIVHAWIRTASNRLKTFVANRAAEIQSLTSVDFWKHVRSHDNPADLLSRGSSPHELIHSSIWWSGPAWLSQISSEWPESAIENVPTVPEMKTHTEVYLTTKTGSRDPPETSEFGLIERFSSYSRLQRVTAYCLRFIANSSKNYPRRSVPLTASEIQSAEIKLIWFVQRQSFYQEIRSLSNSNQVDNQSPLLPLNPFLDEQGIIRVGGRLRQSRFKFDKKHLAVIPAYHQFSRLLARHEHLKLMHAGPQSTLYSLREKFWPLSGRNLLKKIVRECKTCFRFQAQAVKHLMGDLPEPRVTPCRPFSVCGVDYGGPYLLKDRSTRNFKKVKAYICLFVCFSSKAIHIELVSDLTTDAFLASLRRFMARRGKCHTIYSDNATNFQGAKSELASFVQKSSENIETKLAQEGISWKFIPPRSPHFGGLWEAGIRSVKHHIKRVMGDAALTFEQFYTVLVQIEACLNSRPLQPLSTDPNDPVALTPAHFLIGSTLMTVPEPDIREIRENRLSQFQKLQRMFQHFWTRWSKEYVSELQARAKWKKRYPELLKMGSLVLMKEDNSPPSKWSLGRVMQLHPGNDGIVRVATIKTVHGVYKRPVSRLCVLSEIVD